MALLEVDHVAAGYVEGIDILADIALRVEPGSITGIIGPNGAGKSTLLNGGEAKLLSLAKELVNDPALLLVDEPSAGLAPRIAHLVYDELVAARARGVTLLLVDQNITKAVEISDYLYMIEGGQVRREGPRGHFADQLRQIIRDSLLGA